MDSTTTITIKEMVRDFTQSIPRPKSEVRSRIHKLLEQKFEDICDGKTINKQKIIKIINDEFSKLCHLTKDGDCKYWKVEVLGYKESDRDAVYDKFFPQMIKDRILKAIK